MLKKNFSRNLAYVSVAALSIFVTLTQCAKKFEGEAFAPSNVRASVSSVTANNGGALYCSISGGCPVVVTGSDFYQGAKVFFGPYECLNPVVSDTNDQISCTVGPGKSGVFDVSVVNRDGKASVFEDGIDPTNLKFSYASFLYVAIQQSPGIVYGYAQNPETGELLSIVGSPFTITGNNSTYGIVISPNNRFLYTANVNSGTISGFRINPANGQLTSLGSTPAGITSPNGLAFHPTGNYLYVSSFTSSNIAGFSVDGNGTLTSIGAPFSAGGGVTEINTVAVHSSGNFLYGATGGAGGVSGFSIDSSTGALTLLPGSPFRNNTGGFTNSGDGLAIHPNGRWLYMGYYNQRRVGAYEINTTTGTLTGIGTPILNNAATGYVDNRGSGANVSPDGLYFYGTAFSSNGADPKMIIVYNIDQTTGDLTRSSEIVTGGGPNDIRVDTNGLFAYTCNTNNVPSISAYSRNPATGALTALTPRDITIPVANNGPGIMFIQK